MARETRCSARHLLTLGFIFTLVFQALGVYRAHISAQGKASSLEERNDNDLLIAGALNGTKAHRAQNFTSPSPPPQPLLPPTFFPKTDALGHADLAGDGTKALPNHFNYSSPPYELSAVVMFRVNFDRDLLNFTHEEIDQWMTYMQYAGVQHFYFYDNCYEEKECVEDRYTNDPRVTYTRWPGTVYHETQSPAYNHHFQHHPKSKHEFLADIDEYPFMPNDFGKDFLLRFARNMTTGQVLLRSWFFGGARESDHPWRVMRYLHRKSEPHGLNSRTKSLYAPKKLQAIGLHWSTVKGERSHYHADPNIIRLNHYWCERVGERFPVMDKTMAPLIEKVAIFAQGRGLPTRKGDSPLIVRNS